MNNWKDISTSIYYQVNNIGEIRNKRTKYLLSWIKDTHNYAIVFLNNKKKYIHRLVADQFIHNIDNKKCINHKDGNKWNNKVSNLKWCDYTFNNKHARDIGLNNQKGERNHFSKLKDTEILEIKELINNGLTDKEICVKFNVQRSYINMIRNKKRKK